MNVKNATFQDVERAADAIGVRLAYGGIKVKPNRRSTTGVELAFCLRTGEKNELREDWRGKERWVAKYQRLSQRIRQSYAKDTRGVAYNPVIPGAVCWHGHRDFLRALFELAPNAEVRTALATYRGREHFERTYSSTVHAGGKYLGYQMVPYANACTCGKGGLR